jgi:hypothetical protein
VKGKDKNLYVSAQAQKVAIRIQNNNSVQGSFDLRFQGGACFPQGIMKL